MAVKEHDRICTVSRHGSKTANVDGHSYPIWTGAIYEARKRKSDNELTWRRVDSFGRSASGYSPSNRLISDLQAIADYRWLDNVRHGDKVTS